MSKVNDFTRTSGKIMKLTKAEHKLYIHQKVKLLEVSNM